MYKFALQNDIEIIYLLLLFTEVTTVTVSDVQNVFSTSVARAASIPEHVLVGVSFVLKQSLQTYPHWIFMGKL